MIPKTIHYVWLGKGQKSQQMIQSINSWKKILTPAGYKIIEWNEDNWDIKQNKFAYESYLAKKYAYTSDVIRLDVLNRFGGIYLDTDMLVKKDFNEFLSLPSFWSMQFDNTISTSIIGSQPNNKFIQSLLKKYSTYSFDMIKSKEIPETNNEIITKCLLDYYPEFKLVNKKQALNDGTIIFPKEYFIFPPFNKRFDYSDHLFTKTWGHDDFSRFHYLAKNLAHTILGDTIFGKISSYRGRKLFLEDNKYEEQRDQNK